MARQGARGGVKMPSLALLARTFCQFLADALLHTYFGPKQRSLGAQHVSLSFCALVYPFVALCVCEVLTSLK